MSPLGAPLLPQPGQPSSHGGERERLAAAARQFEAIFVRQMLAAARQGGVGDGLFSSQGMQTFRAMQDDRFADIAAQTGALGLARQIEAQLARQLGAGAAEKD